MNDVRLALLFQGVAEDTECGQIQELAEGRFCNGLDGLVSQTLKSRKFMPLTMGS